MVPPARSNRNAQGRSVAAHVRDRQRAVAEREAARLARPEQRRQTKLQHADRKKSAVTSTPFGVHKSSFAGKDDGSNQEWCGPFSLARRMIAEREEAKRKREQEQAENQESHPLDEMMDIVSLEQKKKLHPSMTWKGDLSGSKTARASHLAKRQKRAELYKSERKIPSLFQLCIDFVCTNFEFVESLGDVDNDVRVEISKELVARNTLDGKAFEALVDPTIETLELVDCAGIPQDVMAKTLTSLVDLRYLLLTNAGRCFGPKSVKSVLTTKAPLRCLSISGAYLLTDDDAASLIEANSSTLQSLSFDTCPLLGEKFVKAIIGTEKLLELSLKDMALTFSSDTLKLLTESFDTLRSLTLRSMVGLTDDTLNMMLEFSGDSLEMLDVSHNYDLTDGCLSGIRQSCCRLRSLSMSGVKELTSTGLEALFTFPLDGLPPPPALKVLNLAYCDHHAVTDEVLALVTENSSGFGGLVQLDIQGSSLITDVTMEKLVDTAASTLTYLNVSYCPLVTDKGLGYLVSKTGRQLAKIEVWGCAQLTDEFFDGHCRVNDRSLEIMGAWMKKSGAY